MPAIIACLASDTSWSRRTSVDVIGMSVVGASCVGPMARWPAG